MFKLIAFLLIPAIFLMSSIFSCKTSKIYQIEAIAIYQWIPQTSPPTVRRPPMDTRLDGVPNPYPANIQQILDADDVIYVGLRLASRTSIRFSKYTFFNKDTNAETTIHPSGVGEYGPFSGQVYPFISYPISVPNEPGTYEFRIYNGDKMLASAVFQIVDSKYKP